MAELAERSAAGRALGDRLRSAVELAREPEGPHAPSRALVALHLGETARAVARIDPRPVVSPAPLRRPAALLALLAATLAAVAAFRPGALGAWARALRGMPGSAVAVVAGAAPSGSGFAPVLADIRLTYRPPAYTGLPERTVAGTSGEVRALRGTEVAIEGSVDRAVAEGRLLLEPGEAIPFAVAEGGRAVAATLVLLEPGRWTAEFTDASGEVARDPAGHALLVDPDAAPEVVLSAPAADLEVDELAPLDVAFAARDHFGLSKLALVVVRGGQEERFPLELPAGRREHAAETRFAGVEPPLEPGEEVLLLVEAWDNDTVSGPKRGVSESRRLRVRSARAAHAEVVALLERLLDGQSGTLARTLTAAPAEPHSVRGAAEAEGEIAERLGGHVAELDEILRRLWNDPLGTEKTYEALSGLRQGLDATRAEVASLLAREAPALRRPLGDDLLVRAMSDVRARETRELESGVLLVDGLVHEERAAGLRQLAESILADQKRLAALLEEYRRTGNPETLAEIQRLLGRLEERLAELDARLAELGQTAAEEFVNLDAIRQQLGPDGRQALEKLREGLAAGDVEAAERHAEELLSSLARAMAALESGARGAQALAQARAADEMGRAAARLGELARAQGKLADATDGLQRDLENRRFGRGQDPGEFFARQGERAREVEASARRALAALEQDPDVRARRATEERLRELTRELNRELATGGGLERLEATRDELFRLRDALHEPRVRDRMAAREALAEAVEQAERAGQALSARSLDDALRSARSLSGALAEAARRLGGGSPFQRPGDEPAPPAGTPHPAAEPARAAAAGGHELLRDLQSLDYLLNRPLAEDAAQAERERMQRLAARQKALRGDAGEVSDLLDDLAERAPDLPPDLRTQVGQAADYMDLARRGLEEEGVEDGRRNARAAQERLDEALRQLEQAAREAQGQGEGEGEGSPGGVAFVPSGVRGQPRFQKQGRAGREPGGAFDRGHSDDKVAIPAAESSLAPEAFRRDVLEGMKQPRPSGYEEALERYYRRLVQ